MPLYIPLKPEEKFQAKACIDVLAYRSSKAIASLLILAVAPSVVQGVAIAIFLLWALTVLSMFKVYQEVGIAK
jgi:ATP/ADP translocase